PLAERLQLRGDTPLLLLLPGSRTSEVRRLMRPFGSTLARLLERGRKFQVAIPTMPSVRHLIEAELQSWPVQPHLLEGEEDKFRSFKLAHAALAASGTVTLELALFGTPMVVAYKVEPVMAPVLRRLITADTSVLPNLVLGEKAIPEFHQEDCTGPRIASALAPLLDEGSPERTKQLAALARVPQLMLLQSGTPSEAAAHIVLNYAENGRAWPRTLNMAQVGVR
ncbi:unnamed protein product, partial [marine sediment metagenome]